MEASPSGSRSTLDWLSIHQKGRGRHSLGLGRQVGVNETRCVRTRRPVNNACVGGAVASRPPSSVEQKQQSEGAERGSSGLIELEQLEHRPSNGSFPIGYFTTVNESYNVLLWKTHGPRREHSTIGGVAWSRKQFRYQQEFSNRGSRSMIRTCTYASPSSKAE
ncbi:hypothetical protein CFAM422_010780 [Trichoderma lentiforme]|uniref:Uncharacterized protein n=1 Tax=Trichoderma lentiforme TaxID=1567552 RepID=A0A9P5CAB7_9HYPO|nr:hypothetical protein CFAM422_010780 [Trichoderma lentiforme]